MVDWGEEKPNGEFWMMDWQMKHHFNES